MDVNWRRSWFTSAGVKPADKKRSKPRGPLRSVVSCCLEEAAVPRGLTCVVDDEEEEGWRPVVRLLLLLVPFAVLLGELADPIGAAGTEAAASASTDNSSSVSSSPILQFT